MADAAPGPSYDDSAIRHGLHAMADELDAVRAEYAEWKADINTAVAEGIKHVERAENRIRATVRRAREELADGGVTSPGLEAEARDLFGEHGARGESSGVPTLPEGVGGNQQGNRFAAFPGSFDGFLS